MSNIKASTLKARTTDTETSLDKVNARILSGNLVAELQYVEIGGYQVRVPNSELPVTREDSIQLLNRNRAVTKEEILLAVGKGVMTHFLKKGYIRQASATVFYVTVEAQKYYKLAKPMVGSYFK